MDEEGRRLLESIGDPSPVIDMLVGPGEADNARFGHLLENLRWNAHLSRADAAAKLGFSSEYLRLIETGKRTPALGQMRNFLAVYDAKGSVEQVRPDGYRQDLLLFDPLQGDDGEPYVIEFKSRIREARRTALGGPPDEDEDLQESVHERPSDSRAAELGQVVSLLTRADAKTLRKVRRLLEDHVG